MNKTPTRREKVSKKDQFRRFYKGTRRRVINSYKYIAKVEEPVEEAIVENQIKQTQTEPSIEEALSNLFMSVEHLDSKQNKLNNNLIQNFCNLKIEYRLLEADHIDLKKSYNNLKDRIQKIEEQLNNQYYGLI